MYWKEDMVRINVGDDNGVFVGNATVSERDLELTQELFCVLKEGVRGPDEEPDENRIDFMFRWDAYRGIKIVKMPDESHPNEHWDTEDGVLEVFFKTGNRESVVTVYVAGNDLIRTVAGRRKAFATLTSYIHEWGTSEGGFKWWNAENSMSPTVFREIKKRFNAD